ncbi:MAG: hypothetical protein K0R61_122 [Microvirga sp.]|jgi:hypothetical protein|nr:hypothetical protein [Microvirga sp.]
MRGLAGVRDSGLAGISAPERTQSAVTETLRWASRGFVTTPEDNPDNTVVEGRAREGFTISRHVQVDSNGAWSGLVDTFISEQVLENTDRGLDAYAGTHAFIGRPVRLKIGAALKDDHGHLECPPLFEFGTVWQGIVGGISYPGTEVRLSLQPDHRRLDQPIQRAVYGGSGGLDGTPELQGQTKPVALGQVLAAEPVLLDPLRLIYQWHGAGPALLVQRLRDMGVLLEQVWDVETYADLENLRQENPDDEDTDATGAIIRIGQFATCNREGCFRLGGIPAGRLTLDGRGRGSYIASLRQEPWTDETIFTDGFGFGTARTEVAYAGGVKALTLMILRDFADVPVEQIDSAQILQGTDPAAGIFLPLGGQSTSRDVITQLMRSGLMFCSRNRLGQWTVNKLAPPTKAGVLTITQDMLAQGSGIEVTELPYRYPWPRWRVGWNRRHAALNDTDIATSVGGNTRNFLRNTADYVETADATLKALYPGDLTGNKTGVLESLLTIRTQALTVLAELFELYSLGRRMLSVRCYGAFGKLELWQTVILRLPKLGLGSGVPFRVASIEEDGRTRETRLVLFG